MRNRIVLLTLIFALWAVLKLLDFFITGPQLLIFMGLFLLGTLLHSAWLLAAQNRWRRRYSSGQGVSPLAVSQVGIENAALTGSQGRLLQGQTSDELQEQAENAWRPFVDIFIAGKNEASVIEKTVRNMFKLEYERYLLWVIDDCSTDATSEILTRLQNEFSNLRVLTRTVGSFPGKSAALNEALPLSKGEVIAVFDADAYIKPDFLDVVLPILAQDGIAAVQLQKRIYEHQTGFLVNCQSSEYALDTYLQIGRDTIGGAVELRGNGEVIKRAALVDVGGWNNNTLTDDLDLSMRFLISHWDIRFCPNVCVWEEGVTTVKALMRQRRRWAEGAIRRYLDYIFPLNSPTRLSLVERIDTVAFTVFLTVPTLLLFEMGSQFVRLANGLPTQGSLVGIIFLAAFMISQVNLLAAIHMYRERMPWWKYLWHSLAVNLYIWLHWIPCIVTSLCQIVFCKGAATWHRTEHVGAE